MRTRAQGGANARRHAARRGDLDDDTADRASPTDPRRRGLGALHHSPASPPSSDDSPDITPEMITRLAQRYWELHGGNAVLNWLEAERALEDLLREASFPTAQRIMLADMRSKAPIPPRAGP